ncbi:hypothetical protein [Puia sp.]|jgi:hypothetical protein|uniref:hypothetical protein n=1 Tax=Puia sp. TaxID=2045100 RepID=UPI002F411A62
MKHHFTLLAVAAAAVVGMSSCSSSRNAQTTDDIYYSSGSARTAVAGTDKGDYYSTAPSDNYVRMKAEDPTRWSYFDDYSAYDSYYAPTSSIGFGYGYPGYGFGNPYYGMGLGLGFGYGYGFGDPYMAWNNYFMWNSWYNPYFYNPYYGGGVFVVGHSVPTSIYSNLRPFNSVAYRNGLSHNTRMTNNGGARYYRPGMSSTSNYNSGLTNRGSSRPVNNTFYRPTNPTNNNGGFRPSFSQPTRGYSPSGGGGGGGGFSRPGRH